MGKWVATVAASVLSGVLIWWLTQNRSDALPAPQPKAAVRMSPNEVGIDRFGSDYKDFKASTVDACREACLKDPDCQAISFNQAAGQCWLKNSVPLRTEKPGFVSAVKMAD